MDRTCDTKFRKFVLYPLSYGSLERVTRIGLASLAWEANILPLNYTRV